MLMNTKLSKNQRRLLATLSLTLMSLFNFCIEPALSQSDSTKSLSWKTVITSKDEPGEPMIVSGTVYASDGKTLVPAITVYVYHTDASGYYSKGNNSSSNPRLHGTMITNAEGKYEYRTIKPAAYPGGGNPAHVHYVISGQGYSKQYDELQFEGDRWLKNPNLSASQRGDNFLSVRPLTKDKDGVWRVIKDLKLE
jgi:protocatechuate 3,4-dioxygenase beta subunit